MWKAVGAMVSVELSFAVVNILLKKALNGGMDGVIILVYRQSLATLFLFPFAFFCERSSWNKLTWRLISQMFLCALLGLTVTQYLFLVGLDYTSATFTCAFINIVPVITFLLALPLGMERVEMSSRNGKFKVVGTVVCVAGALILSLYKGKVVIKAKLQAEAVNVVEKGQGKGRTTTGAAFLAAGSLAWSSWFLIMSRIGQCFPHRYSTTSIISFFSSIQSAILCFITGATHFSLRGDLQILTVIFAGIVGSGACYVVMSWCVKRRGPVFTAAFCPLIQFFAAFLDVLLLHQPIYLGSILGSVAVILGMYVLLWGKSKDEAEGKTIDEYDHAQDSAPTASDEIITVN